MPRYFDKSDIIQEYHTRKLEGRKSGRRLTIDILRNWTKHRIRRGVRQRGIPAQEVSMPTAEHDGNRVFAYEVIPDLRAESKFELVELKASLKGRDLYIVECMEQGMTPNEIAKSLNLSRESVYASIRGIAERNK